MSSISRSCEAKSHKKVTPSRRKSHSASLLPGIVPGVVGGERVYIAKKPKESERAAEIRIRIALSVNGCLVWKHTVEPCWHCGKKPTKRAGLGEGATDLLVFDTVSKKTIFIEVKKPGYSPSDVRPMQRKRIAELRRHGGIAGIATCEAEAVFLLEEARRKP